MSEGFKLKMNDTTEQEDTVLLQQVYLRFTCESLV